MSDQAITQICPRCQMPLVLPATYAGQTVPCSRCGQAVLVSGPPTATPTTPIVPPHLAGQLPPGAGPMSPMAPMGPMVVPPHLANPQATAPAPFAVDAADRRPSALRKRRRTSVGTMIGYAIGLLLAVGVTGGGIFVLSKVLEQQATVDDTADDPNAPALVGDAAGKAKLDRRDFTDASRKTATHSGIVVKINEVEIGKARFRSKGMNQETATPNYLMITFNLKNKSRAEPVEYMSWYSYKFEDDEAGAQVVQLADENGVELDVFPIPGAERVETHGPSNLRLPQGDDANDTLVFQLPEGYANEPIPGLYLQLPAAAVGVPGYFRFYIPAEMVKRRE